MIISKLCICRLDPNTKENHQSNGNVVLNGMTWCS